MWNGTQIGKKGRNLGVEKGERPGNPRQKRKKKERRPKPPIKRLIRKRKDIFPKKTPSGKKSPGRKVQKKKKRGGRSSDHAAKHLRGRNKREGY